MRPAVLSAYCLLPTAYCLLPSAFRLLAFLEPVARHVAPEREAAPLAEARVEARDFFIVARAPAPAHLRELAAHPGVEREHVVAPDQLQKVLRRVVADALHALHLALEPVGRQLAREPRLNVQLARSDAHGQLLQVLRAVARTHNVSVKLDGLRRHRFRRRERAPTVRRLATEVVDKLRDHLTRQRPRAVRRSD